jgi:hypothetical protein
LNALQCLEVLDVDLLQGAFKLICENAVLGVAKRDVTSGVGFRFFSHSALSLPCNVRESSLEILAMQALGAMLDVPWRPLLSIDDEGMHAAHKPTTGAGSEAAFRNHFRGKGGPRSGRFDDRPLLRRHE